MPQRIRSLNAYFETYRFADEYDRNSITHVMACSSHFPGYLIQGYGHEHLGDGATLTAPRVSEAHGGPR
jgi:hypothetical protein